MAGVWDEENWFDLMDYSNLDMEGCIRAMQENGMSSSSSFTDSHVVDISEIDRMDEDTPLRQVALSKEPAILASSECPRTSLSPVLPTGKKCDKNSALQLKDQCTFDEIMAERCSPTASDDSRSQPTSGNGVDEAPIGRGPSGNGKAQHTIGNPPDQVETTTKTSGRANL